MPQKKTQMDLLIDKVIAYGESRLPETDRELISQFITLYFSHASIDDLRDRSLEDLFGLVLSHWELMRVRLPDEVKLHISNPEQAQNGWQSTHTIIELAIEDMPFLVDSMRMEINRRGLTTHLMIYMGGMRVARDAQGTIQGLSHYRLNEGIVNIESPIYMEIDRQTDPAVLADLEMSLLRVINDVRLAVMDWEKMRMRMGETVEALRHEPNVHTKTHNRESIAFLRWLMSDHFTFLGARDYVVVGAGRDMALELVPGSGLGVLRDESHSKQHRLFADLPPKARRLMRSKDQQLVISKTNTRSTIHRSTHTDYVGVKRFDPETGELVGERRFIGLYTSAAYNSNPNEIPFLRQKVRSVVLRSRLPERSHSGKDLMHILATLPRDDLFQATTDELYNLAMGILHLQERRKIRLFMRKDAYGRFVSCMVYVPRENFNTEIVNRMEGILMHALEGVEVSWTSDFSAQVLARIHFVIRINPRRSVDYNVAEIESRLIEVAQSWQDGLKEGILEYFGEERGNALFARYRFAFPAGYREVFLPRTAVFDIQHIEKLTDEEPLVMSFYRPVGVAKDVIGFKLFNRDYTIPLSDALPLLENMGLRVISEQPYQITFKDSMKVWINDFEMTYAREPSFEVEEVKPIFQEAFKRVWLGDAENDAFNRLVLEAQLTWREISILRAYTKYLRQTGFTYSTQYIAETLVNHPKISRLLIDIFKSYFDPDRKREELDQAGHLEALFEKYLDEVVSLDEDRILRRSVDVIKATLRTNYFQLTSAGEPKPYIAFKLDPTRIPDLPLPLPQFEIFVYSPNFEGVHLRAGKVARGGLRWSDRREDFRTEILGLMKAQTVKNAVIVPAGAKGGFVPKNLPVNGTRDEILQEGIACYKQFIHGLLDVTDNLVDDQLVRPDRTICYDDHDPYLVVAADKGTATFSDIANDIAIEKGFWLGDAFASGGSTGYDHKKMGITARGAWVSAERQFQELGINVDETEVTVVGIGDMAGDVFGNGMLMSKHLKVVAAFNHQHIFIDPNPDPLASYLERKRLFELPRSSWDDYKRALISTGGGVFSRALKAIRLTPEMQQVLGCDAEVLVPNDLIRAMLKAPVDLIWNGGIGTFVKASTETHDEVGDRTNDVLRVNGDELRARVVCEGGNLGLTQLGRIEYEFNGGKINTDFIDNSAGVDCSDHEVNIKILLNLLVASGDMTEKQRNNLLAEMTEEVAQLVLQNNYHQNEAISLAAYLSPKYMSLYIHYMSHIEAAGKINRVLEFLPDKKTMLERKANGFGLTRPELCVLFAYSKIILESEIRESALVEDPYLTRFVEYAFPTPLRRKYSDYHLKHRLSKEIISTQLSNQIVSDMGITFIYQMQDETGAATESIVSAYAAAREIFGMETILGEIEALDYQVEPTIQHKMVDDVVRLIRRATRWLLRNRREHLEIHALIDQFQPLVTWLSDQLPELLLGEDKAALESRRDMLIEANVPAEVANRIACVRILYQSLNIVEASLRDDSDVYHVAEVYFTVIQRLNLVWFRDRINAYPVEDRWAVLARAACKGDLDWIQRTLTIGVLRMESKATSASGLVSAWFKRQKHLIDRWERMLADIRSLEGDDFAILSVAVRELIDLAETSMPSERDRR